MVTLTMYYVAQGWCVTCSYACEGVEFTKDRKKKHVWFSTLSYQSLNNE